MNPRITLLVTVATLACSGTAQTQDCLNYFDYIHKAASFEQPYQIESAVVQDGILYVASPDTGLVIFDVSNLEEPLYLGGYSDIGTVDIHVDGNIAYLLGGSIYCIDVSNPSSPELIGQGGTGSQWSFEIQGDYAYIAGGTHLSVVDISNPEAPITVWSEPFGNAIIRDIAVNGSHLLVTEKLGQFYQSKLLLYDVSAPESPEFMDSTVVDDPWSVDVDEYYAYVGANNKIRIFRTYSTHLDFVADVDMGVHGYSYDISILNNLLFAAKEEYGVQVIKVENPYDSVLQGSIQSAGSIKHLKSASGYFCSAGISFNSSNGFVDLIDNSNLQAPPALGSFEIVLNDIDSEGDYVYGASSYEGFNVLSIANPESPFLISELSLPNYARSICVKDSVAFVSVSNNPSFYAIDISMPWEPSVLTSTNIDLGGTSYNMKIVDNIIYHPNISNISAIIDVTDIYSPFVIGHIPEPANAITGVGDFAYCARRGYSSYHDGFSIYDVSNPESPIWLGGFNLDSDVWDIAVSGNHAYLATGELGLVVVDVSDATSPSIIDTLLMHDSLRDIEIVGNIAYAANYEDGITLFDITNPRNSFTIYTFRMNGRSIRSTVTENGIAFVSESIGELKLVYRQCNQPPADVMITDVPDDQGGFIEIEWEAFPLYPPELLDEIIRYEVERYEGAWVSIVTVMATSQESYSVVVETDDIYVVGEPEPFTDYRIVAYTADETAYYTDVVGGYSIDNLAPPTPEITIFEGVDFRTIIWEAPEIDDLDEMCVYRDSESGFTPGEPLVCPTEPIYSEDDLNYYCYVVQFSDIHGNLSEFSNEVCSTYPTDTEDILPHRFALRQNHPNPFNPKTTISYELPSTEYVDLRIYDSRGRLVRNLLGQVQQAGLHSVVWDGKDSQGQAVASGTYIYRLDAGEHIESKRMVLIR